MWLVLKLASRLRPVESCQVRACYLLQYVSFQSILTSSLVASSPKVGLGKVLSGYMVGPTFFILKGGQEGRGALAAACRVTVKLEWRLRLDNVDYFHRGW